MTDAMDYNLSDMHIAFRKKYPSRGPENSDLSISDSFVAFFSSTLGAGVLSVPLCFAYAGIIPATIVILFVCLISYSSNYALLNVAQRVNAKSYSDVVEKTLGKSKTKNAILFFFLMNILSASISYLIAIHWALTTTVSYIGALVKADLPNFLSKFIS